MSSKIDNAEPPTGTSFREKSIWIQLLSLFVALGGYFLVAGLMLYSGDNTLPAFVPLFIVAVALLVLFNAVGHAVASIANRQDERDERDRLIGWRAESNSSWVLAGGVITAIGGLVLAFNPVWVAHLLLVSLFASEIVNCSYQLVYYRRGV